MQIRLYIGDRQVDLSEGVDILFNWTETDLLNPLNYHNGYSKTIVLEGTNTNNEIFGHFWDLERYQSYSESYSTGVDFNPSYRVPFTLYFNDTVYESGYVKLQRVITSNNVHKYEIGLFGGLGSFLYNLDIDWSTGEKRTLADMSYFDSGVSQDLSFTINKETVQEAWDEIYSNAADNKWDKINLAPTTYNGFPTTVDSDKVLINLAGTGLASGITEGGSAYTAYRGYALGQLPEKMTSEEVKDYRSYLQTPVLRVKSIFDAIGRKENNTGKYDSGWDLVLDNDFFTTDNPYFWDSWLTLNSISLIPAGGEVGGEVDLGSISPINTYDDNGYVSVYPINASGNTGTLKVSFKLRVRVPNATDNSLHLSWWRREFFGLHYAYGHSCLGLQAYTSNSLTSDGNDFTVSKLQWLTESVKLPGTNDWKYLTYGDLSRGWHQRAFKDVENVGVTEYDGKFNKVSNGVYEFEQPIEFEIDFPSMASYIKIKTYTSDNIDANMGKKFRLWNKQPDDGGQIEYLANTSDLYLYNSDFSFYGVSKTNSYTDKYISQDVLLNTSFSPAEFLISFCKMFGLYIHKDIVEDKIYIDTRNTFYKKDKTINLNELIDTSKEININPLYVDTNYVLLSNEIINGTSANDYATKFNRVFGSKILDTGYEFNADTKDICGGIVFKNAIQTKEQSKYFFKKGTNNPYVYNGLSYLLYKDGDYRNETKSIDVPKVEISQAFEPFDPNYPYYDFVSKAQFEDKEHKGLNTEGVLLFFNGFKDAGSYGYYLTDDNDYMTYLNNNPCWLMTNSEYDSNGVHIALKINDLPRFSRYYEGNHWMMYSWDFGSPRELYVPDIANNDEGNIYYVYFKDYYEDLYDVNTKVLTCYIKANNLNEESLRNIYWFLNGLWRLNKIYDYNPDSPDTTKCEFIKIQDLDNISNGKATTNLWVRITLDRYEIGQSGGTIIGTVRTSDNYGWNIEGIGYNPNSPLPRGLVTVTPESYGQSGNFFLTVPPNIRDDRTVTIYVTAGDIGGNVSFTQPGVSYSFGINPTSVSGSALSYSKSVTISNPYYYDWVVESKPSWVTASPTGITNGQTGTTGTTACTLTAQKNTGGDERTGTITFKETTYNHTYSVSIKQAGYNFSVSPNSVSFGKNGESKTVTITNPDGYRWEVQNVPAWITTAITGGNLVLTAQKNIGPERTSSITVRDLDFEVSYPISLTQEDGYVFSISPAGFVFEQDGDDNYLEITNPNGLSWTVSNYPAWVTISPSAGTGTSVSVAASQNTGLERSATSITVRETTYGNNYYFYVVQESGYYFAVSPTELSFTSGATNRQFRIYDDNGYNWEIDNIPSWCTVNIRTGNSSTLITVSAQANISTARTANLRISETTYGNDYYVSLSQDSGFNFVVSPLSFSFAGGGESKTLTISNPNGYNWAIEELPWWITVSQETGNTTTQITVTAAANTSGEYRESDFAVYEATVTGDFTYVDVSQEAQLLTPTWTSFTAELI